MNKALKRSFNYLVIIILLTSCETMDDGINEIGQGNQPYLKDNYFFNDPSLDKETNIFISDAFTYRNITNETIELLTFVLSKKSLSRDNSLKVNQLNNNLKRILKVDKEITIKIDKNLLQRKETLISSYELSNNLRLIGYVDSDFLPTNFQELKFNFCNSLQEDSNIAILSEVNNQLNNTILINDTNNKNFNKDSLELFSKIISFNNENAQDFSSEILGINESKQRYSAIKKLSSGDDIKFTPRINQNLQNIIFDLQKDDLKKLLPAFKYNYAINLKYYAPTIVLSDMKASEDLIDLEGLILPSSFNQQKNLLKINHVHEMDYLDLVIISDWLLINFLKELGINKAEINGYSGKIMFLNNNCSKRSLPMIKILPGGEINLAS